MAIGLIDYILVALTFFASLFIALLVLAQNRKSTNIVFSIFSMTLASWIAAAFFSEIVTSDFGKLCLSKISYALVIFTVFFLVVFTALFINVYEKISNFVKLLFIVLALFISYTILFTEGIVREISSNSYGFDIILGNQYFLFISYVMLALTTMIYLIVSNYSKIPNYKINQVKYLFFGIFIAFFCSFLFNVIMKELMNSDAFYRYGNYSLIFVSAFTSYAIVKHRLMDIRLVVARSIAYSVLVLIVAAIYAGSVLALERIFFPGTSQLGLAQGALRTVLAVLIAFTFQPLRKILTKITDRIFFKEQYDPEAFLKETNKILSTNIILTELLYKTLDHIIQEMRILEGTFVVVEDDKVHTIQSIGYKSAPDIKFEDVKKLSRIDITVYDELEEGNHLKNILRKYEASVVIRLMEDHQFAGLLILGEKKSGDMFTAKDIEILEITAPEITMAMQRAKQYEEIQKFNLTLRAEVMRKTKKLREANEHLQEFDKAKDEFISMASHQLRTPLTAIKGYLSMLLEGDAGEIKIGQYDFINEAFQGANKMVNLINDLLNVSRMSTGKFFIDPMPLDMKKMIQEEMKQLTTAARQKGLFLKFEAPADMPKIEADENKIRQVIMNFIDNSVYYTEKGGVTVKCSASHKDFVFEVRDTGIGVPKEMQQKLFAKFYRADNARRLRPDGTGLGLYLAKRVIEDHKGELIFRSTSGKGSVFGFRLPIHSPIKVDPKKHELLNLH